MTLAVTPQHGLTLSLFSLFFLLFSAAWSHKAQASLKLPELILLPPTPPPHVLGSQTCAIQDCLPAHTAAIFRSLSGPACQESSQLGLQTVKVPLGRREREGSRDPHLSTQTLLPARCMQVCPKCPNLKVSGNSERTRKVKDRKRDSQGAAIIHTGCRPIVAALRSATLSR